MKNYATIEMENESKDVCFDIRTLARMERRIGTSIITCFKRAEDKLTIDFTIAGLLEGADGIDDIDQAYDFIDQYCSEGGTLDDLNAVIVRAILDTGIITNGKKKKPEKQKKEEKK